GRLIFVVVDDDPLAVQRFFAVIFGGGGVPRRLAHRHRIAGAGAVADEVVELVHGRRGRFHFLRRCLRDKERRGCAYQRDEDRETCAFHDRVLRLNGCNETVTFRALSGTAIRDFLAQVHQWNVVFQLYDVAVFRHRVDVHQPEEEIDRLGDDLRHRVADTAAELHAEGSLTAVHRLRGLLQRGDVGNQVDVRAGRESQSAHADHQALVDGEYQRIDADRDAADRIGEVVFQLHLQRRDVPGAVDEVHLDRAARREIALGVQQRSARAEAGGEIQALLEHGG